MRDNAVTATALVFAGALATILGALAFEHIAGLAPCPLCYTQRWFYYAVIPLSALLLIFARAPDRAGVLRVGLGLIAVVMLASAGMGLFHAGVEYKWWEGPQTCAGGAGLSDNGVLPDLDNLNIVRCDEPAWTLFGLSLAGYNVLISLALAAIALWGMRSRPEA